jgi:hypothetical protein
MKRAITSKIFYLTIILLFTSVAFSEPEWITFPGGSGTPGEKPIIIVESNSTDATVYTVQIPGMYRDQVMAPNGMMFDSLEIPEYGWTLDVGKPMIPVIRDIFAVPYDSTVDISITDVQEIMLSNYYIYPSQQLYPYCEEPPPFEWDEEFYNQNVWYPLEGIATGENPGVLRELEVRDINMRGMKFNPYQRELNVKYFFRVTMTYENPGGWIPEPRPSGDFYQMYPYLITNLEGISGFGDFGKQGAPGQFIYLIIHDKKFDNDPDFRGILYEYTKYLTDRGFIVDVHSTTDIGDNRALYIWDFLKKYYYDHNNLEYVLLVGDIPQYLGDQNGIEMPRWTVYESRTPGEGRAPSDMGYERLTPLKEMNPLLTDIYPDITVGRMVVNNTQEFANIVNKTTNYFYSDNGNYPWEKHCLLVAGVQSFPAYQADYFTKIKRDYIANDLNYMHYMYPPLHFKACYGQYYDGTNENVRDYINGEGCSIINYWGHGITDVPLKKHGWYQWYKKDDEYHCWDETWIAQLNNSDKLVVVFQLACQVGQLDDQFNSDCLCEYWMNSPNGAVACCGCTRDLLSFCPHLGDYDLLHFIDAYWFSCIYGHRNPDRYPIESFGTVVNTGIVKWICTYYIANYQNNFSIVQNLSGKGNCLVDGITIYGDPSLKMRSGVDYQSYAKDDNAKKEVLGLGQLSIDCIYPNPSYDNFNYKINVPTSGSLSIHIYDVSGRLVSERTIYVERPGLIESSVDVRNLLNGVYTFNAEMNGSGVSKRIVIVR